MSYAFELLHTDGRARRGTVRTPHGVVQTPVFMPVGTQGAVKALTHAQLQEAGASIMLGNTYHLHLRLGDPLIARRGGLHRFTGWTQPILTDSGGYQVFSLSNRRTLSEEGVTFRSHLDGSVHVLSPERAVDIQARLGSDIAMTFDECLSYPAAAADAEASMMRTLRWARRARHRFLAVREGGESDVTVTNKGQAQFGIVQGSVYADLRERSVDSTIGIGFEAYAIGGLSVGEPVELMYDIAEGVCARLPADRPRYLMGTGTPVDLVECVARGVDMFDCVLPTRNARNGQLFTSSGRLNIKNAAYADDDRPLDDACVCYTCRH